MQRKVVLSSLVLLMIGALNGSEKPFDVHYIESERDSMRLALRAAEFASEYSLATLPGAVGELRYQCVQRLEALSKGIDWFGEYAKEQVAFKEQVQSNINFVFNVFQREYEQKVSEKEQVEKDKKQ